MAVGSMWRKFSDIRKEEIKKEGEGSSWKKRGTGGNGAKNCGIPIRESSRGIKNAELAERILKNELNTKRERTKDSNKSTHRSRESNIGSDSKQGKQSYGTVKLKKGNNLRLTDLDYNSTYFYKTCKENRESGANTPSVTPSNKSTFKFTPTYLNPEVLRECKIDADLATAIAQTSARKQNLSAPSEYRRSLQQRKALKIPNNELRITTKSTTCNYKNIHV